MKVHTGQMYPCVGNGVMPEGRLGTAGMRTILGIGYDLSGELRKNEGRTCGNPISNVQTNQINGETGVPHWT